VTPAGPAHSPAASWPGSGRGGAPKGGPRGPEINITPLVDVVLVLLIIFMVIAPQMQSGQPVATPEVGHPDPEAKGQFDPITVSVTRDGTVWIEKDRIDTPGELEAGIKAARALGPDRKIVLQADRNVRFQTVRSVFARCQTAGATGIALKVTTRPVGAEEPG
jgi:biopolymer transport protein TolR